MADKPGRRPAMPEDNGSERGAGVQMSNDQNANTQEQDLGELLRIRREKLAALKEEGKDP